MTEPQGKEGDVKVNGQLEKLAKPAKTLLEKLDAAVKADEKYERNKAKRERKRKREGLKKEVESNEEAACTRSSEVSPPVEPAVQEPRSRRHMMRTRGLVKITGEVVEDVPDGVMHERVIRKADKRKAALAGECKPKKSKKQRKLEAALSGERKSRKPKKPKKRKGASAVGEMTVKSEKSEKSKEGSAPDVQKPEAEEPGKLDEAPNNGVKEEGKMGLNPKVAPFGEEESVKPEKPEKSEKLDECASPDVKKAEEPVNVEEESAKAGVKEEVMKERERKAAPAGREKLERSEKSKSDRLEKLEKSSALTVKKIEAKEPAVLRESNDSAREDVTSESMAEPNVETNNELDMDTATGAPKQAKTLQEGEIKINRAPVLTMWVAAVAERQGFTFDEAVTFGKSIAGLFAHAKGKRIGVVEDTPSKKSKKDMEKFEVFGCSVYGKTTAKGRFALESGKAIAPNVVKAYLQRAFKDDYDRVRETFELLANSFSPEEIGSKAYDLYEKFRPDIPDGSRGWGARGLLNLKYVKELAASG
ncbi:uncharacterized protein [Physcomitrium patens]|uniref:Uncharacterized protein n=1 Tax=Physcomitrium patens TaxID=3218 RepID=A0A7I4BJU3_PHYPA|nr:calponin homology domain-containing protein DDB_G0272472-like isoform X1 [Physcomitrium patens]XP_024356813.1 calponin homology domain-containing protein DDB_G0272472-like isoform X1 [Physcomitrium patens]XP_024356814.1 calponin homology domain-containing protein DDB_G0272472-like isoform X1 [Physcomitrium patens]|eukprot:XP_024356812.1 calponin homology domain-containing protein DDB_G0272472-like isoform X1 [Physcomitrella patens]